MIVAQWVRWELCLSIDHCHHLHGACLHYRIRFHREEVRVVDASVVGGATDHQN